MLNQQSNPCCDLGHALYEDRLLCKTDNFFVVPTVGSIGIEGYLLIVSNEHFEGVGSLPPDYYPELNNLVGSVQRLLLQEYGTSALVFEHGPRVCGVRGGGCLDHAHLHVVPGVDVTSEWASDMMRRLERARQFYRVDRIEGFERIAEILDGRESSYVFVESPAGVRYVAEVTIQIPSQYFRRMIASQIGSTMWDWRMHPDTETLERTIERLRDRL